jgi:uncharacterized damage-inducible protein DinB
MAKYLLTGAPPESTEALIEGWGEFTPASDALDGLTADQAMAKPEQVPHSIVEIVAHLLFWQKRLLKAFNGKSAGSIESAAVGWPKVKKSDWPRLKAAYLEGLEQSKKIAQNPALLDRIQGDNYTVGFRLLSHLGHDAYHLGQIVLIRRMFGAWPPPGGGNTW